MHRHERIPRRMVLPHARFCSIIQAVSAKSSVEAQGEGAKRQWASLLVLAVLLAVALALRWRYVREISLFVDEFVTAWAARAVAAQGLPIFPSGNFYPHGITFTYLEAPFVAGQFDEALARVPALLVSLVMIVAVYGVGRRLLSETAGLVAAAALAVDPDAITWGSRARMYGLLQLLALLAVYFFFRGLAEDRPRYRLLAMGLVGLAILTHAEAIFLLPVLGLAALAYWPWRRVLRWSVVLPFGIGLAAAAVYYALARFGQPGHLETLQESRPYLALGVDALLTGPQLFAPVFLRACRLPFSVLALAGLYFLIPPRLDRRSPLTYLMLVLGAFTVLMVALAGATWQNERYLFIVLPLLFLVAGQMLDWLAGRLGLTRRRSPSHVIAPSLAVAVALFVGLIGSRDAYVQVWGYDQAFRALRDRLGLSAGDRVVTPMPTAAALYLGSADYFAIQEGYQEFLVPRPEDGVPVDLWTATPALTTTAAFTGLLETAPRVWFVVDGWRLQTRYKPDLIQAVAGQMTKEYDERGVMILRAEGYAPAASPAVQRERSIDFGEELRLTGFGLSEGAPAPGGELEVVLSWQAGEAAAPAYTTFLHLVAPDGTGAAGVDEPLLGGLYQPNLWPPGWMFTDRHRLALPAGLPAGHYRLDLGFYYPDQAGDAAGGHAERGRVTLTYLTIGELPAPPPAAQPLEITFGEAIRLAGVDWDGGRVAAGGGQAPAETPEAIRLTLHWEAVGMVEPDYKVFVHLVAPDGTIAAQDDVAPGGPFYPTSAWLPGDVLTTSHTLDLPAGAAAGSYRLLVGLYDPATDARLPAAGADGQALGDTVEVGRAP